MSTKEKKVIYVMKDSLDAYPPCISQIVMLRELGVAVEVITEICNINTRSVLENAGATVHLLGNLNPHKGLRARIEHWINFKRLAFKKIKEIYSEGDILWLGSAATGMVLKSCVKKNTFILNVLELYDTWPVFKKLVGKVIKFADAVVVCELNRGRIMKQWYNLTKIPYVMPNKPYYELSGEKTEAVVAFQESIKGTKYILYQGILDPERPLDALADAMNKTKEKYTFVIIGSCTDDKWKEALLERLQSIYPDVIYGGYFPAPQHLYVTENAYIGVAVYDASSLNTMFCAPNKTFEYSKFTVPILGSDIPGLQLTVEKYGAGICVDIENSDQIAKAIDKISENYAEYQKGAKEFYNSVDNLKITKEILKSIDFF